MGIVLEEQRAAETLRQDLPKGIEVDFERMFPEFKGFGVAKANKKRLELLKHCAPVLRAALEPGEQVLYVSQGMVNDLLEQYFAGAFVSYCHNRSVIVATDRRYIVLHCDGKGKPCQYVNEVAYDVITKVKPGGMATSFVIVTKKGNLSLANLGKTHGKRLMECRDHAAMLHVQSNVERTSQGKSYLCPACYAPIERMMDKCPRCMAYLKSPKSAAFRSLLLPGLGDLYLGHKLLGLIEMAGALALILILTAMVVGETTAEGRLVGLVVAVCMVGFYHTVDALVTYRMGKKGMIAEDCQLAKREA